MTDRCQPSSPSARLCQNATAIADGGGKTIFGMPNAHTAASQPATKMQNVVADKQQVAGPGRKRSRRWLAHASKLPAEPKCRRIAATKRPNSGVFCMASVRGRGKSMSITSTMRPGRGVMTTTRSAR